MVTERNSVHIMDDHALHRTSVIRALSRLIGYKRDVTDRDDNAPYRDGMDGRLEGNSNL